MKNVFAVIGFLTLVVVLVGCGAAVVLVAKVNQVPSGIEDFVATLEAAETVPDDNNVVIVVDESEPDTPKTIIETVYVEVTAVPTETSVPAEPLPAPTVEATYRLFDSDGEPVLYGPLSGAHVELCKAIVFNGNLDTLLEPQRSMCEVYK